MFPFWAPLSAVSIGDPPAPATAFVLKRLLGRGRPLTLTYLGDRMHPSVRHGQSVSVASSDGAPRHGAVVLAVVEGIPDLLRVVTRAEGIGLVGDADPGPTAVVGAGAILGLADLPARPVGRTGRRLARLTIDWREASGAWLREAADPAESVLGKYDDQAAYYAHGSEDAGDWPLRGRIAREVPPGGRVLVAGSGTGRECFSLEQDGFAVSGIDFSPRMVAIARERAARRGSRVPFVQGDLRGHDEPEGSLDAVVFTYDVYSFIPGRASRVETLARIAGWLRKDGVVFLSARRIEGLYSRAILARARLRRAGARGAAEFGDAHSRWIGGDGEIRRAFVKSFTRRALEGEIQEAGLTAGPWESGHLELRRTGGVSGSRTPTAFP